MEQKKNEPADPSQNQNEGEGSKSADRHYREGVQKTVEGGKVEQLGQQAKEALEGPEGDELRRAEEESKKRGNGAPSKDTNSSPRH